MIKKRQKNCSYKNAAIFYNNSGIRKAFLFITFWLTIYNFHNQIVVEGVYDQTQPLEKKKL